MVLRVGSDSLRFDVSITLGGLVAQGVITGGSAQIYLPTERVVLTGTIEAGSDPYGATHDRDVLYEMILGPALAWDWRDLAARVGSFDVTAGQAAVGVDRADGTQLVLTVGPELEYLKSMRVNRQGDVYLEISYRNYRSLRGALLPQEVILRYPREEIELVFEVVSRTVRPEYAVEHFALEVPAGIRRLRYASMIPPAPR